MKEAVRRVTGEDLEIVGASRTDSGAKGQVCHFDSAVNLNAHRWVLALNRQLPLDLAVKSATAVPDTFNSRFCADDRHYCYRIAVGEVDPLRARFHHHYGRPLDLDAMQEAALHLVGKHDFRAYTEELDKWVANTRREVRSVRVARSGDEVHIHVVATAFLRGMMRRISGLLLDVGRGKRPPADAALLLTEKRDTMHWPVVLPAKGLTLERIRYGRHPRDNRTAFSGNDFDTLE